MPRDGADGSSSEERGECEGRKLLLVLCRKNKSREEKILVNVLSMDRWVVVDGQSSARHCCAELGPAPKDEFLQTTSGGKEEQKRHPCKSSRNKASYNRKSYTRQPFDPKGEAIR